MFESNVVLLCAYVCLREFLSMYVCAYGVVCMQICNQRRKKTTTTTEVNLHTTYDEVEREKERDIYIYFFHLFGIER